MKKISFLAAFLVAYLIVLPEFTTYMKHKPFAEKIGYTLQPEVARLLSIDQKQLVSASLILKVIFYYGSLIDRAMNKIYTLADLAGMRNMIETAIHVDPYNSDGYYFAQAILVWNLKEVETANKLLAYGMKYRNWDWYLPFFAGFNYAYFQKDYGAAALQYKRVGELKGSELSMNLAGRYMYEAGHTNMAIAYLQRMVNNARNQAVKKSLQRRLHAFIAVQEVERAVELYRQKLGKVPDSVEKLVKHGYLKEKPLDPYGGKFYIDEKGVVRTTSKFAFGGRAE